MRNEINKYAHIQFLESTLIPDLVESGQVETAKDFCACCLFMATYPKMEVKDKEVDDYLKKLIEARKSMVEHGFR